MGPWSRNSFSLCYNCFIKFRGCVSTFQRLWNPNSSSGRHIEVQHWEARNFPWKMYPRSLTAWFYPWTVIMPKKVFHSNHHFSGMKKKTLLFNFGVSCVTVDYISTWHRLNFFPFHASEKACIQSKTVASQDPCRDGSWGVLGQRFLIGWNP